MMPGYMIWRSVELNGEKILHLKYRKFDKWTPYDKHPEGQIDYDESIGSKGWATFQELKKKGWILEKSND